MNDQEFKIVMAAIAAFSALVSSCIGAFIVFAVKRFTAQLDTRFRDINEHMAVMSGSVGELNQKIAVIITVQDWHMKEIEQIKTELKGRE